tara:strand:- start:8729 stop:9583 length:855 start_codon:yes stop_codon:yes gene_type:complete
MPIVYPYLPTNADFSADPLNVRFEEFIGATSGLNKLTVEDLSVGALRHNHLPRLIHRDDTTYAELTAAKADDPNQNLFSVMRSVPFGSTTGKLTPTNITQDILTHTQSTPFALGMSDEITTPDVFGFGLPTSRASDNIAALLVLANVNIQRFIVDTQDAILNFPCEDRDFVVASIVLVDSAGDDKVIERTARAVSPRVTINYETAALKGSPLLESRTVTNSFDNKTNQDISIRTVISADDLAPLTDVAEVRIRLSYNLWITSVSVEYNKANLTVIPIHAKLNDV